MWEGHFSVFLVYIFLQILSLKDSDYRGSGQRETLVKFSHLDIGKGGVGRKKFGYKYEDTVKIGLNKRRLLMCLNNRLMHLDSEASDTHCHLNSLFLAFLLPC